MSTKIFVNLPVKDLKHSMDFFRKLGYSFNPQFTDENAACMVISEDIYAMLLRTEFFKNFTTKELVDATRSTEMILSLTMDNRTAVDEMLEEALAAGATETMTMDEGWMYQRGFADLDGHLWEIFYMDMAAIPPEPMKG